ncbi:uncharacterized protein [Arachis hypogaea]|uniref:uncharacterized protein n=1 Tax=Arachis hypogaea TaxID=3818 RepID=UPI003B20BE87
MQRALKKARELVISKESEQYSKLRDYLAEILRSNAGSTALLGVEPIPQSPPLFDKLYICLDACKQGFKAGCRPLIGLDECFLKGYYGGQLLSVVAQDSNNHFYVIAYVVGLLLALREQYKNKQTKGAVWECARCTTAVEFKASMDKLKKINKKAWAYLAKFEPAVWVKAYFSHDLKVDNLTNNMCEVWNSRIVDYRVKPETFGWVQGKDCTSSTKEVGDAEKGSDKWQPQWIGDDDGVKYEVQYDGKNVMPCVHAIFAIAWRNERPEDYCHPWLQMSSFNATYQHCVQPVLSEQYWERAEGSRPIPPKLKRPIGRPKLHARRKDHVEPLLNANKANLVQEENHNPAVTTQNVAPTRSVTNEEI